MRSSSFMLAFAVAPLASSSAFVPSAGLLKTNQGQRTAATPRDFSPRGVFSATTTTRSGRVFMTASGHASEEVAVAADVGRSRAQFLGRVSAAVAAAGVATIEWGGGVSPALADSTGKYSSKATARRRFLPRIVSLVAAFQALKKDIASGSATSKSEFFVDVLPDGQLAMELFGSSFKRGETPDSISRALQQLAKDFGTACKALGKSLDKGNAADAGKAYDKAAGLLEDYLKGTKLDPMGSEAYK